MKKRIILWAIVVYFVPLFSFDTLEQLQEYVKSYPEYPPYEENTYWLDPDYSEFHKSIDTHWWDFVLRLVRINNKPKFNKKKFVSLLKEVVKKREKDNKGNFVSKLCLSEDMKCIVMGDLQGELHGLCRILTDLYQQDIIDNRFKIISSSYCIIFNGDILSRSAYTLETLMVLFTLLKKNPERVIWVRGGHEDKQTWHNFSLKRELQIRLKGMSKEEIPFNDLILRFFDTLPLSLYLQNNRDLQRVIKIGYTGKMTSLNEAEMGSFFNECTVGNIRSYKVDKKEKSKQPVEVVALIRNENWYRVTNLDEGLHLLEPEQGITSWSILSSPVSMYKMYYDFFYDAYAVITMGSSLADSTITLRNQDTRFFEGFKSKITFYIMSGQEIAYGQDKPAITLGTTLALNKKVFVMGRRVRRGMIVRLNKENQQGGIHGQRIRLVAYDDQYEPRRARTNIQKLLKENINMILLPVGSPTLQGYIDLAKDNTIAVFFPVTGGPQFREKDILGIVHWRASYKDEARTLMKYITQVYQAKKFAFFYQNDAYGLGPLQVAHDFLKEQGISTWTDVPYIRMDVDFKGEAEKINSAQPEAIGLFSAANATRNLLRYIGAENLITKTLFGISFLAEESLKNYLQEVGLHILFSQIVPNPITSQLPIVREYREEMDKYKFPYDVFSLEAYIATSLLIECMKQVEGPITKDSVMKVVENIKNMNYKGLQLTFDPATRELAHYVWLETGESENWIEMH